MLGQGYHLSTAWGAHVPCTLGFSWTNTQMPGGAIGVWLKSTSPWSCAQAESLGLRCDPWSRLSISVACRRSQSHKCREISLSMLQSPAIKWLNVYIAHSAALQWWTCGGTNWKSMDLAAMFSLSALNASLSSH